MTSLGRVDRSKDATDEGEIERGSDEPHSPAPKPTIGKAR
jgi:hypothetical protein